ncbi:MAG TPA: AMP-binding protein [candidate division Zixibacteria bacterium]|nr:AMP-binding protein [candidate division Zixibacteria bacterium]
MKVALPHDYWNPHVELMSKSGLRQLQLRRLKRAIDYAWRRSPYYRKLMTDCGITPDDISTLEDFFERFPVTRREDLDRDLLEHPPYGTRLAVPLDGVLRYHTTSGTTGKPPVRALDTDRDWVWGAGCWASSLYNFGVRPDDNVMIAFGYGSFVGFWGAHYGFEKIGCRVHPTGGMDTRSRIRMILDLQITTLCCTPSYALRILHVARDENVDLGRQSRLDKVVVAGEPGAFIPSTRAAIEDGFNAHLADFMGTTETAGMLAFTCAKLPDGAHINEDKFLTEVVDPHTLRPLKYGEKGMMVITPLVKQAMPLFRYATNDIVVLQENAACPCRRVFDLLKGGILGRYDDLVKVRGIQLTPRMVEEIVREFPDVEEFFTTIKEIDGLDSLVIQFELRGDAGAQRASEVTAGIRRQFKTRIGLTPVVEAVPANSLPRFELKARRFVDQRPRSH